MVAVLTGGNDGIEIVGVLVLGVLQGKIVDGGKEIDDGHGTEAESRCIVKAKLSGSVQGNPGCFAGGQHDDRELGQGAIPDLAKKITLGAVIVEAGLGGESGRDGVHVLVLQFGDDFSGGDAFGQVDHNGKVVVQDVQRRHIASPADPGRPFAWMFVDG